MLTEQRKGELALMYLKEKLFKDGITIGSEIAREVGNTAKKLNIPIEEAREFAEFVVCSLVERAFSQKGGGAH